jgi:hypothetical protein
MLPGRAQRPDYVEPGCFTRATVLRVLHEGRTWVFITTQLDSRRFALSLGFATDGGGSAEEALSHQSNRA